MPDVKQNPLISAVVPVYNAERTIEACVKSLLSQTFKSIEVILVNNCSTDASLQKCMHLSHSDQRIRVVDITERGVSSARNKGIEAAVGKFVTFVDADDWIDSDVCEIFAKLNDKYNYDLFCYSAQYHRGKNILDSFLFSDDVELLSENQKEELQIKVLTPDAPIFEYKTNTRFAGSAWGKFYKREILLKNNLQFSPETIISEDVLFNTLALDCFHRIGYTRKCFYHYEQQEGSAQNRYRPDSDRYFSFVIANIQSWLREMHKNENFVDSANCLFVHYLFGILKEDLCHRDNPRLTADRKKMLEQVLSKEEYHFPLENAQKDYFNLPERVLIWMLRKRFTGIIFFLLKFVK